MNKPKWVVAGFSGGKDSTAMVIRMIELGEQLDEVICCDTFKEFPAMYRHIEKVKTVIEAAGIKFTVLRADKSFDYLMFEHKPNRKKQDYKNHRGYSWPGPRNRWCTSKLKIDIVRKYLKRLSETHQIIQCNGIAADEQYRLDRKNNQMEYKRHPLVEWGWNENDCLNYCYSKGYDWEGLYEIFRKQEGRCPRVSCWCCPLQSLEDLRRLRENFPDLWRELKDMDNRTWRQFQANYSVEGLEVRFDLEKEFEAKGKSIRNREFFDELKKRLS